MSRTETMDRFAKSVSTSPRFTPEYANLAIEHQKLVQAVKRMHAAKGRYHSQQATCDLYELIGLSCVRPEVEK